MLELLFPEKGINELLELIDRIEQDKAQHLSCDALLEGVQAGLVNLAGVFGPGKKLRHLLPKWNSQLLQLEEIFSRGAIYQLSRKASTTDHKSLLMDGLFSTS